MTSEGEEALLEGAASLLREAPPPLPPETARALVAEALRRAREEVLVDAFAGTLAATAPPPGPSPEELVRRAIRARDTEPAEVTAREGERDAGVVHLYSRSNKARNVDASASPLQWVWMAAAAAFLAVGVGLWAERLLRDDPAAAPPLVHRLAGGHVITATGDARLALDERGGRVAATLESGEALFDVAPGSDVRVTAGDVLVRVTGTVFTVARRDAQVHVRVYEGAVEVRAEGRAFRLAAGEQHAHGGFDAEPRLAARGRAAAARRVTAGATTTPLAQRADAPRDAPPPSPIPASPIAREDPAREDSARHDPAREPGRTPPTDPPEARPPEGSSASDPGLADAAARRALVEGRYNAALRLADEALARGATVEWRMIRGDALRGLARPEEAVEAYDQAMRHATGDGRAVAGLSAARVLASLGRTARAREVLRESGALDPSSSVFAAAARLEARLDPP